MDAIEEFWSWWASVNSTYASAVATGGAAAMADVLSAKVHAIHGGLDWELCEGMVSRHALCLSAANAPDARTLPHRWMQRSPEPTAMWEYHPARIQSLGWLKGQLAIDGHDVVPALLSLGVVVDDERQLLDVTAHHPEFAGMAEATRFTLVFLALDWAIGEHKVERWIGRIDVSDEQLGDAVPVTALGEIVEGLAKRNDEHAWAVLGATDESGNDVIVTARRPLKPVDHPLYDLHGALAFPLSVGIEELHGIDDDIDSTFGHEAVVVATEVRAGTRTVHLYCDQLTATRERIQSWSAQRPVTSVMWTIDPSWSRVAAYR